MFDHARAVLLFIRAQYSLVRRCTGNVCVYVIVLVVPHPPMLHTRVCTLYLDSPACGHVAASPPRATA